MAKKDLIAIILAGGRGSRLGALTQELAKPAVPFGSRYRIVDFALSNVSNSGIDTVGVLTQYEPLALNTYISNGHPWDLDRNNGGAFILPPYENIEGSDWYKNTANSVYQNIGFMDKFSPEYVVILSGDHIYKMDYSKMLSFHLENDSDCTIAVKPVPWDEAPRFGIMNTNEKHEVEEFEEKPAEPKSNLASMGIYIFTYDKLRQALIEDDNDPESQHDFGGNIIPKFINENKRVFAYEFEDYWKDVGTIFSLWEANMDLIDYPEDLDLRDKDWRIYSRNAVKPAAYLDEKSNLKNSLFTDGGRIFGEVNHSVLSHSVIIEAGAKVEDSFLMPGAVVKSGAVVKKAIIGTNSVVSKDTVVGGKTPEEHPYLNEYCSDDIAVVANNIVLKEGVKVPGGCLVEELADIPEDENLIAEMKRL